MGYQGDRFGRRCRPWKKAIKSIANEWSTQKMPRTGLLTFFSWLAFCGRPFLPFFLLFRQITCFLTYPLRPFLPFFLFCSASVQLFGAAVDGLQGRCCGGRRHGDHRHWCDRGGSDEPSAGAAVENLAMGGGEGHRGRDERFFAGERRRGVSVRGTTRVRETLRARWVCKLPLHTL